MSYKEKIEAAKKRATIKDKRMSILVRSEEREMLEKLKEDLGLSYNSIFRMAIRDYYYNNRSEKSS